MISKYTRHFLLIALFLSSSSIWAQKVPATTGSNVSQSDAQAALDFHNKVRKDVGTPALEWSTELAAYAQAWADHLAKDENCNMKHRPSEGEWRQSHGENIFWGSSSSYNVVSASESWYSEIKDYKHEALNNSNWYAAGHYTQMVWRNTTKVGIAQVTCPNGAIIIVGNYDPPGNYMGEKAY